MVREEKRQTLLPSAVSSNDGELERLAGLCGGSCGNAFHTYITRCVGCRTEAMFELFRACCGPSLLPSSASTDF